MFRTLLSSLFLAVLATPNVTLACSCESNPPLEKAVNDSPYIFMGRIDQITPSPYSPGLKEIRVSVQQWFKGREALDEAEEGKAEERIEKKRKRDFVVVYTADKEETCGFSFYQEQDYIIFAKGSPARLKTDTCSGTVLVDNFLPQMKKLADLAGKTEPQT